MEASPHIRNTANHDLIECRYHSGLFQVAEVHKYQSNGWVGEGITEEDGEESDARSDENSSEHGDAPAIYPFSNHIKLLNYPLEFKEEGSDRFAVFSPKVNSVSLVHALVHESIICYVQLSCGMFFAASNDPDPQTPNLHTRTKTYVLSLTCSLDDRLIISCPSDKTARIWDIHDGRANIHIINDYDTLHNGAGVIFVAISPNGQSETTGNLDEILCMWGVATGSLVERRGHRETVITPDGKGLTLRRNGFGQSGQRTMDFTGRKDHVLPPDLSYDGKWIVSGSKCEGIRFWDFHSPLALALRRVFPKSQYYDLRDIECRNCALLAAPTLLEVPYIHKIFQEIATRFHEAWKARGPPCPSILRVFKVVQSAVNVTPYNTYREAHGNQVFRYHGTQRRCSIGDEGRKNICDNTACSVCSILRTSFRVGLCRHNAAFGPGIYTSSDPNKSARYAPQGLVFITRVVLGKVKNVSQFYEVMSLPRGYDSVVFEQKNEFNETVVYVNEAIRPTYLIVLR